MFRNVQILFFDIVTYAFPGFAILLNILFALNENYCRIDVFFKECFSLQVFELIVVYVLAYITGFTSYHVTRRVFGYFNNSGKQPSYHSKLPLIFHYSENNIAKIERWTTFNSMSINMLTVCIVTILVSCFKVWVYWNCQSCELCIGANFTLIVIGIITFSTMLFAIKGFYIPYRRAYIEDTIDIIEYNKKIEIKSILKDELNERLENELTDFKDQLIDIVSEKIMIDKQSIQRSLIEKFSKNIAIDNEKVKKAIPEIIINKYFNQENEIKDFLKEKINQLIKEKAAIKHPKED